MAKGVLLTDSGKKVVTFEEGDGSEQLAQIKDYIGCDMLDAVVFPEDIVAWVDEEGLMKSTNYIQRLSFLGYGPQGSMEHDLVGPALLTSKDAEGRTLGLTEKQLDYITNSIKTQIVGDTL